MFYVVNKTFRLIILVQFWCGFHCLVIRYHLFSACPSFFRFQQSVLAFFQAQACSRQRCALWNNCDSLQLSPEAKCTKFCFILTVSYFTLVAFSQMIIFYFFRGCSNIVSFFLKYPQPHPFSFFNMIPVPEWFWAIQVWEEMQGMVFGLRPPTGQTTRGTATCDATLAKWPSALLDLL